MFKRTQSTVTAKGLVSLAAGSLMAIAAGNAQAAAMNPAQGDGAIGGRVWADLNNNGIQEDGEEGIPGVVLNLETQSISPSGAFQWDAILTETTDADGNYVFEELEGESFRVHVVLPSEDCAFSPRLQGGNSELDSDVRPETGRTGGYSPSVEDPTIFNVDAGLDCPVVAPDPTVAEDDAVRGRVGRMLLVDVLGNDMPSDTVESIMILSSTVPGDVTVTDDNQIKINNTTERGDFEIEYKLTSTSGSMDTAIVKVELTKKRRYGGCRGGGFGGHHGHHGYNNHHGWGHKISKYKRHYSSKWSKWGHRRW